MFNGFPQFPLFLPPSLATWSGFSGHKIPAVFSLIASPKLFPVSSYLVLRSVTDLYSLNSFQRWLSDLKGVDLSSIRTKSQVVTPILTRISAATFKERVRFGRTCAVLRRGGQNDRRRASLGRFSRLYRPVFVGDRAWVCRGTLEDTGPCSKRPAESSKQKGSLSLDAASRPDAAVRIAGTRFCVCPLHAPALGDRDP